MKPIGLFVEICAGLASVSGVLQHGAHWKPPISRMGRKTGYAEAILRVMGIRPRQGAECYLWAEADSDVAALLAAYTQPEVMRQIADTIRSWIPCPYGPHEGWCSRCKGTGRWDARDLWETLRREKRRGLWEGFETTDTARFALHSSWSYEQGNTATGFVGPGDRRQDTSALALALALDRAALPWPPVLIANRADVDPLEVAGWLNVCARSDTINHFAAEEDVPREGRPTGGGWRGNGPGREGLAERCITQVWPPVLIAQDARIEPGEVAGFIYHVGRSIQGDGGFVDTTPRADGKPRPRGLTAESFAVATERADGIWPPVHLTPDATIRPAHIPPGTVVYMDPDYQGTTGYKHTFPRKEVIATAERWKDEGARVYISEAEPIEIKGWHHVDIGGERKGQARTFSKQQAEWLTCSHPPAWTPPKQGSMF